MPNIRIGFNVRRYITTRHAYNLNTILRNTAENHITKPEIEYFCIITDTPT